MGLGRGPKFADMFPNLANDTHGFSGADEFLTAIDTGRADSRIMNATSVEGVGSDGGFLVPPQYVSGILDQALGDSAAACDVCSHDIQRNACTCA